MLKRELCSLRNKKNGEGKQKPEKSRKWEHLTLCYTSRTWVQVFHTELISFLIWGLKSAPMYRDGQNHIYTVYIRNFWQGNHWIYGRIRCICTVLANPRCVRHTASATLVPLVALLRHVRKCKAKKKGCVRHVCNTGPSCRHLQYLQHWSLVTLRQWLLH